MQKIFDTEKYFFRNISTRSIEFVKRRTINVEKVRETFDFDRIKRNIRMEETMQCINSRSYPFEFCFQVTRW